MITQETGETVHPRLEELETPQPEDETGNGGQQVDERHQYRTGTSGRILIDEQRGADGNGYRQQ